MGRLDNIVSYFRQHTYAESTKKTYNKYLKSYLDFCDKFSIAPVPLSPMNLARYVAHLSDRLCYNSLSNYISIIRLLHREAGVDSPLDCFYIDTVLKGAKRALGSNTNRKLPITPLVLRDIFSLLDLSCSQDLCFWAACLVAFFSFLRKSNLFPPSTSTFNPMQHLSRSDIVFSKSGCVLNIRGTKTIQFRERMLCIPLPVVANSPLCPAKMLLLNFKMVPAVTTPSPAFLFLRGGNTHVLTYSIFLKMLQTFLKRLGYDCKKYSGHSFRRGGASFAFECGLPSEFIQSQGDWKSDAYKTYIDPSFAHRQKIMHTFACQLSKLT